MATQKRKTATQIAENGQTAKQDISDILKIFSRPPLPEILHDLENLLSQSRLAFLMGAGCSFCAGLPLMDTLTKSVLKDLEQEHANILNAVIKNFDGAPRCTIEDYMSELVDLIALAERRRQRKSGQPIVRLGSDQFTCEQLEAALHAIKLQIANKVDHGAITDLSAHRAFIRAVHKTLRTGRGSSLKYPIDYFTLNYDTLLEDSLALEQIQFADGFVGGATGWWNIAGYEDPNSSARVFKLHGSIDWCSCDGDTLPRRIRHGLKVPTRQDHLLIWPAATKYRETQRDPYAQLVSLMRKSLRPSVNTESVLAICGYAFADEHINAEIDRAMRECNERLSILVFTSDNEPAEQLRKWLDDPDLASRIRVHANRGFYHSDKSIKLDHDTPWWKFEILTQLISGHR